MTPVPRWLRLGILLVASALLSAATAAKAGEEAAGPGGLSRDELATRQGVDGASLATYRAGLARTVAYARATPALFPPARPGEARLLTAGERAAVRSAWKSLLDYTLALSALEAYHADYPGIPDRAARARSFHLARGAFLAAYRFALDFIAIAENDPKLGVLMNDSVDDLGLPAGSYDRYKFRFLNVTAATRYAAYELAARVLDPPADPAFAAALPEDAAAILAAGRGRGEALTAANAVDVVRQVGARVLFPAQAGISEWMGDTRVLRHRSLISPAQIQALRGRMRPGDIMLQRREWYLSNVGLPGFWSHAALYVGTPEERRASLGGEEVRRWVAAQGEPSGDLEALLRRAAPGERVMRLLSSGDGHPPRVIEAISEGVVFTTMEHSADADSIVVLRPKVAPAAVAAAIARAWAYAGRPYDFNFDFQTDSALVCTELVYKAYEPSAASPGVRFHLEEILGRTAIPANSIARQFDQEYGTPAAQFEFVAFLDGQEKSGVAVEADVQQFRASWRRPKWHVLVQGTARPPAAE